MDDLRRGDGLPARAGHGSAAVHGAPPRLERRVRVPGGAAGRRHAASGSGTATPARPGQWWHDLVRRALDPADGRGVAGRRVRAVRTARRARLAGPPDRAASCSCSWPRRSRTGDAAVDAGRRHPGVPPLPRARLRRPAPQLPVPGRRPAVRRARRAAALRGASRADRRDRLRRGWAATVRPSPRGSPCEVERDEVDARARPRRAAAARARVASLDAQRAHRLRVVGDGVRTSPPASAGTVRRTAARSARSCSSLVTGISAGDDRHVAAGGRDPVAQPQVVVGVEEHLGDRVVGAGAGTCRRSARCPASMAGERGCLYGKAATPTQKSPCARSSAHQSAA